MKANIPKSINDRIRVFLHGLAMIQTPEMREHFKAEFRASLIAEVSRRMRKK